MTRTSLIFATALVFMTPAVAHAGADCDESRQQVSNGFSDAQPGAGAAIITEQVIDDTRRLRNQSQLRQSHSAMIRNRRH